VTEHLVERDVQSWRAGRCGRVDRGASRIWYPLGRMVSRGGVRATHSAAMQAHGYP